MKPYLIHQSHKNKGRCQHTCIIRTPLFTTYVLVVGLRTVKESCENVRRIWDKPSPDVLDDMFTEVAEIGSVVVHSEDDEVPSLALGFMLGWGALHSCGSGDISYAFSQNHIQPNISLQLLPSIRICAVCQIPAQSPQINLQTPRFMWMIRLSGPICSTPAKSWNLSCIACFRGRMPRGTSHSCIAWLSFHTQDQLGQSFQLWPCQLAIWKTISSLRDSSLLSRWRL